MVGELSQSIGIKAFQCSCHAIRRGLCLQTACQGIQTVPVAITEQQIMPFTAFQQVLAQTAIQDIITAITIEGIVPLMADQCVLPR